MDAESLPEDLRSIQRRAALAWSEEEIESTWRRTPIFNSDTSTVSGFPYPADAPTAYIKFGHPIEWRLAEFRNHTFVYDALQRLPREERQGIYVPEVYRTMRIKHLLFIIMEYIPGKTLAEITADSENWKTRREGVIDKISQGIKLLLSLPVPCDAKPGPVGGGIIRHPIFKDSEAAIVYDSIEMLERHLNKVARPSFPEDTQLALTFPGCNITRQGHTNHHPGEGTTFLFWRSVPWELHVHRFRGPLLHRL